METLPPLTPATFWAILNLEIPDAMVNALVWHALGYRWETSTQAWDLTRVDPQWATAYPVPPDFIDSRPATIMLTRSIPSEHKQLLKENLGFTGYTVAQLTPQKTRRATAVNWLLSYQTLLGGL